ncbi:MAG TPA: TolC family protein [Armatimonadota bacterium]|nr:TolC family protein [Armatimonadota bacterium]
MSSRLLMVPVLLLVVALAAAAAFGAEATVAYTGPELTAGGPEGIADVVPLTLSLEKAIEIAITYNPGVAASGEDIIASTALVMQATSRLMPRLDVEAARTTPVDLPPFSFQSPDSTWETNISFSQPLYAGGSLRAGVKAARDFLRGSEGAHRRTGQETAFAVRRGYYAVLAGEEQVNVAKQVVDSALETLRVAKLRYEAGVAPQFDVLSAEARGARVEQGLITAEVLRDTAWAVLSTTLGVPIPAGTQLTTPRPVEVAEEDPVALRAEALANRPDLLAAEASAAAARGMLAVAKAGRLPTVGAAAGYSLREQTTVSGDVFGDPGTEIIVSQNSGYLALTASWSLFNGGQVAGEIGEAEARLRQAQDAVVGLQQQVELDTRSAYLAVAAAKAQVAAAHKEVDQQQEAYRIATIRYQEGVGTSVEILGAEADLGDAKTRLNGAIFDLNLAIAELDLAVGRDQPLSTPTSSAEGAGE